MSDEILFWLALLALFLFRQLAGRKKPSQKRPIATQSLPPNVGDDRVTAVSSVSQRRPPAPAAASEFEDALAELRGAFGFGRPDKPQRDVEAFGQTEELFEQERPYRDYSQTSEERFESKPAFSVPVSDREDAFERKDGFPSKAVFYDEGFESKPRSSEVDFRDSWHGHDSDFEYHSALEKSDGPKNRLKPKTDPLPSEPKDTPLISRLRNASDLKQAVILHEILGPPVSLRGPVRRRPF